MDNYYNNNAQKIFNKYQGIDSDIVHAGWLKWMPSNPSIAVDVRGGSGRDALWLAEFENELYLFPYGKYDDQVDSLTQFLDWMQNKPENKTVKFRIRRI